jgi:hypothetical protein
MGENMKNKIKRFLQLMAQGMNAAHVGQFTF